MIAVDRNARSAFKDLVHVAWDAASGGSTSGGIRVARSSDHGGLASFGGISHPIWTDSRRQLDPLPGCSRGLAMEEVFTATVR
jgi:hypothetical protein